MGKEDLKIAMERSQPVPTNYVDKMVEIGRRKSDGRREMVY